MYDLLLAVAAERGGYLYRSDFIDCGYRDSEIRAMMKAGLIERIRHGTYAVVDQVRALTPEARHLLVAYSVIDKLGPGVALSHQTAAIAHTGVSHGVDLSTIHLTKLDGRHGREEAGVAFHVGAVIGDDDLREVGGRLVTKAPRAVIESCSLSSVESGMVTVSFAIRNGACSGPEILESMGAMERWPGMARVRLAVAYAEPRCESVGELRSMFMFRCEQIPMPEPQFLVMRGGVVIARTDFGWLEYRHVGEFDGRIKYGRLNPDLSDPGQVVFQEKRREDKVRGERLGMSRWTWRETDPENRRRTARRIRSDLAQSRRLYARNAVHIPLTS